jgi:hypothetical protein
MIKMIVGHLRRKPNLWPFTIVSKGEAVSGVEVAGARSQIWPVCVTKAKI